MLNVKIRAKSLTIRSFLETAVNPTTDTVCTMSNFIASISFKNTVYLMKRC